MNAARKKRSGERRWSESVKPLLEALLIALIIRTFLFQPFSIPSGSMEPTLLVGDYLFVSKFSYGYSRYSVPFAPPLFSGRLFASMPRRGDVVVFRHGDLDYIKRVIGLPGDTVQLRDGVVIINGKPVERERETDFVGHDPCRPSFEGSPPVRVMRWRETLPDGPAHDTLQCVAFDGFPDTTDVYRVPPDHFFMMGDNRENSEDSRFPDVGYVPFDRLIGRAQIIFFSVSGGEPAWKFWRWPWALRWGRLFGLIR
jgi:signal peptidase I